MDEIYFAIFRVQCFHVNSAMYIQHDSPILGIIYGMTNLSPLQGQIHFFHYVHHLKADPYYSK
jgi:hypothetical protein